MDEIDLRGRFSRCLLPFPSLQAAVAGKSATSRSLDRSMTASASAEKSRPNSLTVSRYADLAGSPSAPSAKLSRKLASASLTPIPISPSDGVFAIVRWSISTRLCRRSSSPWSAAAISASRACSHSRHHLSNSTSSFVVRCDFLGIGHPLRIHTGPDPGRLDPPGP